MIDAYPVTEIRSIGSIDNTEYPRYQYRNWSSYWYSL